MFLFNWKRIVRYAGTSSNRILLIVDMLVYDRMPLNIRDPIYNLKQIDFTGHSFLASPTLLLSSNYTNKEKAQYVALASYRNLGDYNMTGNTSLDFDLSPVGEDIIKQNRLLQLKDNKIHFKYEDYNRRK